LRINAAPGQTTKIIPSKIRWVAIAAGSLSGFTGSLLFGPLFLLIPSPLILGAIVQPYSPRPGRSLMSVGAFFLSLYAGLFVAPQAYGAISMLHLYYALNHITLLGLLLVSLSFVIWCDIVLVADSRRLKSIPGTAEYRFTRAGDWVVYIAAGCLSLVLVPTSVWGIFVYRRTGRFDILALSLVLGLVSVLFDVVLVIRPTKMRRAQRSGNSRI
jgi:hypothetical protein